MNKANFNIDDIIVEDRVREDEGDIEELGISLLRFGQLSPLILDQNNKLVAGKRRLEAAKLIGWREVWAVHEADVSASLAVEIELEENIRRKQMTAAEEIKAIAKLDEIKRAQDPYWGQTQTAEAAGIHRSQVSVATQLAKMVDLFPELKDAKSIRQLQTWAKQKAASITRVLEVRDSPEIFSDIESRFRLGDSVEIIKEIPSESFHAVITDPPFGIGYDERASGTVGSLSDYEDSEDSYERLLTMGPDLYRVIKPSGWLIWFCGISWYERCKEVFRHSGFTVDEVPIIWDRSEGRCFTTRPDLYFTRGYDIALHCHKGDPQIVLRNRPNIIRVKPVENAETLVERPIGLYEEIIRRLTIPGEVVADFFAGSGSCLAAAASLNRQYYGVELDAERRAYAIKKIKAHTPDETNSNRPS